jgi:Family of unknown function (DUF5723)
MKNGTLLLASLMLNLYGFAQINFNEINNLHTSNAASKYLPSLMGRDSYVLDANVFNAYATAGNSFISLYDINHIGDSLGVNEYYFDQLLEKSRKKNTIFAGTDLDLINTTFHIRRENEPFLTLGFGIRQRNEFQFTFDKNLLALLYQGNAPFAGQSINLLPNINYLSLLDYHVSGLYTFKNLDFGGSKLKAAATLHRYVGISNVETRRSNISFYTNEDGRYIDVTADLDVHVAPGVDSAYLSDTEFNENTIRKFLLKGHGSGWGIDLGASMEMNEHIDVHASLIDVGYIRFNDSSLNYTRSSTIRYDGVNINGIVDPTVTSNFEGDSLINFLKLAESREGYTITMPTKFLVCAEWHSPRKNTDRIPYSTHRATVTYAQGLSNYLSVSAYPCLNLGYTFSAGNIFSTGFNATLGGMYSGIQAGGFVSLRLRLVKVSVGSNNLLAAVSERSARASDGFLSCSILF